MQTVLKNIHCIRPIDELDIVHERAFQLITGSSIIELIDQKSVSVTHIAVNLVCVTKFTHSRVK